MPPHSKATCPMCGKMYYAMSNHMQRTHGVKNLEERRLLLNLASRRVNVRTHRCPVADCSYHFTRLDNHLLQGHQELRTEVKEHMLQCVRRARTIELLQALRNTEPSPPMTDSLDLLALEDALEPNERADEPPPSTVPPSPSSEDEAVPGPSSSVHTSPHTPTASAHEEQRALPASFGKTCPLNTFKMCLWLV